ncbi:MAG TPA: hypothetical protein GX506_10210 [Firmicutes bacterium]|nr:hypothetical protein [Bacillota bacterium]
MLDYLACRGETVLHRAAPWSKMLGAALTLCAIVLSRNLGLVGALVVFQVFLLLWQRLLIGPVLSFTVYPLIFGALFALSQVWTAPELALLVLLKSEAAGLVLITLMVTTPYIDIFSTLQRILPRVLVDMLFMTYRGIFILLERLEGMLLAVKLRKSGGIRGTIAGFRRTAESLGALVIDSFDLVERIYRIMEIRGYDGGIRSERRSGGDNAILAPENTLSIAVGVMAMVGLVIVG